MFLMAFRTVEHAMHHIYSAVLTWKRSLYKLVLHRSPQCQFWTSCRAAAKVIVCLPGCEGAAGAAEAAHTPGSRLQEHPGGSDGRQAHSPGRGKPPCSRPALSPARFSHSNWRS